MQRQATPIFFSAAGKHMRKKRDRLKNFCINTDHLGNTRVSFKDADGNGSIDTENEVVEVNSYYPFGLQHQKANQVVGGNLGDKFKFNGVELNETLGLYEMPFRQYDPAIARFTSIDPVTHYSMSTYTAFDNNPVFWSDPSGANAVYNWGKERYEDEDGNEVSFEEALASHGFNADGSKKQGNENDTGACCDDNDKDFMSGMAKGAFGGAKHAKNLSDNGQFEQAQKIHDKIDKQTENLEQYWESLSIIPGSSLVSAFAEASKGNYLMASIYLGLGVFDLSGGGKSQILNTTKRQLQAKFKHAVDFGITGNWNKDAASRFSAAINEYINSNGVKAIEGTYRGQSVIHHVNPNTGLNVISSPSGQFISGWKLTTQQLQNVIKHGGL